MTLAALSVLACMNAVVMETNEARKLISKAEKLLDEGQTKKALRILENNNEEFTVSDRGDARLEARLELLRAVAQIRTTYIKLGLSTLQPMLERDPENPLLRARVAEGLSRTRSGPNRAKALQILEDLERRDLMPDAQGWATLAELRDASGDTAGSGKARERCSKIAKRPDVCSEPKGAG